MATEPYGSDVTDEKWEFVASYLTLMNHDAPEQEHDVRVLLRNKLYRQHFLV